jgi:hypothetical protein
MSRTTGSTAIPAFSSESLFLKISYAMLLAAATCGYLLLWYNRFLGLSSNGWFYFFGQQILHGSVPYRDFYLYVPPLHPLKFAALGALFGDGLIVPRIAAVVERVVLAVLVYFWLLRVFTIGPSFLGSLLGVIAFCSDQADALSLHHHDSVLWAVSAGLLASFAISSQKPGAFIAGSGFFAALCFFTKQTTGAGVSFVIPLILLCTLKSPRTWRRAVLPVLAFAAGWAVPAGLITSWLSWNGAFSPFLEQVFIKGPTSKGPLWMVLLRPFLTSIQYPIYLLYVSVALVLLFVARGGFSRPLKNHVPSAGLTAWASILGVTLLYAGVLISRIEGEALWVPGFTLGLVLILVTLIGTAWLSASLLAARFQHEVSQVDAQLLLVAGVSMAVAVMLSLSWIAYGPMAMPGLALIVAMLVQRAMASPSLPRRIAVFACTGAAILLLVSGKLQRPFGWEGWTDGPVSQGTAQSNIRQLKNFRLPPPVTVFLERVTTAITANSDGGDAIYVFPWAPLFYTFSQRKPATFAYVHWFDVTPDYVARRDAAELRAHPPTVIVYFPISQEHVQDQERRFRAGGNSGQRELIDTVEELAKTYKLVDAVDQPYDDRVVLIYVRRPSQQPATETMF